MKADTARAAITAGTESRKRLTPRDLSAVTSFVFDRRAKVMRVVTSTRIGEIS